MTRYIVTSLHRIDHSTAQRFNGLAWRSPSSFSYRAFTIIELVVVLGLIIVLTGLILSTVGYARKKGARARAETEIAAMSAALENYKADNGIYARDAATTDSLDSTAAINMATYQAASQYMYGQLAGDPDFDGVPNSSSKVYMQFKPNMLGKDSNDRVFPRDPFGNSYGYSTKMAAAGTGGYNPTFDLWSTAGLTTGNDPVQWIKNW